MISSAKYQAPPEVLACYLATDKAIKALNLYMGKGKLVDAMVGELHTALGTYLAKEPSLVFAVTPLGFTYEGERLSAEEKASPYYFDLFKDGVRELAFDRGVTDQELRTFLGVLITHMHEKELTLAGDAAPTLDQDTVTRLWEAELEHIRYHAIDAYATGEVMDPEKGIKRKLSDQVAEQMERFRPEDGAGRMGSVDVSGARAPAELRSGGAMSTMPPAARTAEQIVAGRKQGEADAELLDDRFVVVWARLARDAAESDRERLATVMVDTLTGWMSDGEWERLNRALRVLLGLMGTESLKPLVEAVLTAILQPEELQRLAPAVTRAEPADVARALTFFRGLGGAAVEQLLIMLADAPAGPIMGVWEKGFVACGWDPTILYLTRLGASQVATVKDAIGKLNQVKDRAGVADALRKVLQHKKPDIRYTAIRALEGDRHEATVAALQVGVTDKMKEMRSYAIRALAAHGGEPAQTTLLERVSGKDFKALSSGERKLLLTSLARVGGEAPAAWFREELDKKSFFAGKKLKAWQAELTSALREADTPGARALLGLEEDA